MMPAATPPRALHRGQTWRRLVIRAAALAALWVALVGADWRSWLIGFPAIAVATLVSVALLPAARWRLRWRGVLPFTWFFVRESVRGGIDVASRALRPGLPLNPGVFAFTSRLPNGPSRLLLCAVASLLPGTLVVSITPDAIEVHTLDLTSQPEQGLRSLETRIAALIWNLDPPGEDG